MTKKDLLIGIDQGTTGTTVLAIDPSLHVVSQWYGQHSQHRPGPGLLEHDPVEILDAVIEGVRQVMLDLGKDRARVAAAGLANQGETVCSWDLETGQPLYRAIVWSDSRGEESVENLTADQRAQLLEITGLHPDSYFSAPKIRWLLDNVPQVRRALADGRLGIGTLDTWIIWRLSHGSVYQTDLSTASRTMLCDLAQGRWSGRARTLIGLPPLPLARIGPSCGPIAGLSHDSWPVPSLPLLASLVDQPAALFAHGCWETGQTKATYGTGCFLLVNTGQTLSRQANGLAVSVAWDVGDGPIYILDGAVYAAGSVVEWMGQDCGWFEGAGEIDGLLADLPAQDGLLFVPTVDGVSGPHWRRDVRGLISGLTLSSHPADIVRAALDGIAHQVVDLVECVPRTAGPDLDPLCVDGGLSGCDYLMQKQADLLGGPVQVSENRELTALGAAVMAGLAAGVAEKDDLLRRLGLLPCRTFHPDMDPRQRQRERAAWKRAVDLAVEAANIGRGSGWDGPQPGRGR